MSTNTCYLEAVELRQSALNWLLADDPERKANGVSGLQKAYLEKQVSLSITTQLNITQFGNKPIPGRPSKPELVPPLSVKKRSMRSEEGRAALIHALCHIEFNAINLALDAV